jgi:hypothetical protein
VRGQVVARQNGEQVVDGDSQQDRQVEPADAAQRGMAQVKAQAERQVSQGWQLQKHLRRCSQQHSDGHAAHPPRPAQGPGHQDDGGIEDDAGEGGQREALQREQGPGEHTGNAQQDDAGEHQPQQPDGKVLVLEGQPSRRELDQLRRQPFADHQEQR